MLERGAALGQTSLVASHQSEPGCSSWALGIPAHGDRRRGRRAGDRRRHARDRRSAARHGPGGPYGPVPVRDSSGRDRLGLLAGGRCGCRLVSHLRVLLLAAHSQLCHRERRSGRGLGDRSRHRVRRERARAACAPARGGGASTRARSRGGPGIATEARRRAGRAAASCDTRRARAAHPRDLRGRHARGGPAVRCRRCADGALRDRR